jgi:Protein of unknown function (DUF3592)
MKVVQQTPTQLVVHEGALRTALLGTIFAALGGGLIILRVADSANWTGNGGAWLVYLVGGMFLAVGIASLVSSADRRIVIDRAAGTARIVVQGLGRRTSDEYALADLTDVALERSSGGQRQTSAFYRIVFLTRAGGRVPWTPYSTADEGTLASCASAARACCGWVSAPPPQSPAGGGVSGHPVATNWGCAGSFLAVFVAIGLGLFGSEWHRLATWQPVSARVLSTDIKAVRGDKGTSYAPVVRYQYSVDGTQYISSRVLPLDVSAGLGWAERLRNRFRSGDIVTAYVNPRQPGAAFLVHEASLLPLWFVALPLAVAGLLAWVSAVQRRQLAAVVRYPVPVVEAP